MEILMWIISIAIILVYLAFPIVFMIVSGIMASGLYLKDISKGY